MAASTGSTFSAAVHEVLDSWTVLKIAVDNGFGGPDSQEKAQWMVFAIEQWFKENKDIEYYEMEDFLADVMSAEFDTVVDDGSLTQTATLICNLYRWCQEGNEDKVRGCLQGLPKASTTTCQKASSAEDEDSENDDDACPPLQEVPPVPVSADCHGDMAAPTPACNNAENSTLESNDVEMEEVEEGWQTVRRGKRK